MTTDNERLAEFEAWLRSACFQKPTPEAYDLAKDAWIAALRSVPAQGMVTETMVEVGAKWLANSPLIQEPKLPYRSWMGLSRHILEAALAGLSGEAGMSDTMKGLYNKFIVQRSDGSSATGRKHEHCEYFVLDLSHDRHVWAALDAYAVSCSEEYPLLAKDLWAKIEARRKPKP